MLKLCKNKLPLANGKCRTKFVRKNWILGKLWLPSWLLKMLCNY